MEKIKCFARKIYRVMTLAYLWVTRIVFAKSYFKVPLHIRIRMNINGYLSDQYVLYDLKYNRMLDYLSEMDWYKSRYVNGKHRLILNDKIVCNDLLRGRFSTPLLLCSKREGRMMNEAGHFISMDECLEIIRKETDVFLKPINSGKGKGVSRICRKENKWFIDGKEVEEAFLRNKLTALDKWYLSQTVRQGEFPQLLFPDTANTLRLVVIRDPETNECRLCFAVQRIGTRDSFPVDNGSRGGLSAKVDPETGELSSAKSLQKEGEFEVHPDTGFRIKGSVVPNWQAIKEQVISVSEMFPYLKLIAWDVLITEEGLCMIEANASSGVNILQLWGGLRGEAFGAFLRYHKIIRR